MSRLDAFDRQLTAAQARIDELASAFAEFKQKTTETVEALQRAQAAARAAARPTKPKITTGVTHGERGPE